ncbi:16S rRNA (cytosine(1402)-N(4))-methyltransferase RsmH [Fructilactobacillus sanfranciscensis]|mgnify:CR=1 FL=1|uniref:Ribosomal RNA small subunit methyltransferase H n=1 Tax=Fructilactobacillus sanfranciscensis TaxID=1625 RepID=A0A5C4TM45_FRUSA|nr:16S rRNA (cytosine(1402)-N(4))-methyltransferase RsmH [Fructilactobacillus sanfranciscensis]KRM81251.1 S-adenosyl-L-methionine-dependent methyltransferase mraW [Fructilactobacillus sanfranciscensis DSM 20451]MCG7194094.1 16S rRNA (cytosine(1402)-N(4))-methyltransferase RsmH [Fructilactobacillus sanfranciscensis]MCG7195355.1 16S rRNA (cytosine(1402)-N(4))-methyltransferase RsmH [Fructilactobacillus sanfranciscensis]MDN4461592.1 16S rRNA (cytosine(1402)-N(4))-methyltransferase RsmH [Fructilact
MTEFNHVTVMLNEAIDGLEVKPDGIYVDCTLGGGGHSALLLSHLTNGHLYSFDQDDHAIEYNKEHLKKYLAENELTFIHDNFRNLAKDLSEQGVSEVDGIVYDLGVSSPQFDDAERGFSYQKDARLDMRMDQRQKLDAWKVVNEWPYEQLVRIFFRYGEEKFSKQVARSIERIRADQPINTTTELAEIIKNAIPAAARRHGGNPAKKVFQAIRIAVNDELGALEESLEQAIDRLKIHGRISVITFQPLEDRLVKRMFKEKTTIENLPPNIPVIPEEMQPHFKMVQKKPILPSEGEQLENRRSHSAKLRIIERIK